MSSKQSRSLARRFWALIGKILWLVFSVLFRIAAALGSRWARKKLDDHQRRQSGHRLTGRLRRR